MNGPGIQNDNVRTRVFVSYSRKDVDFARQLAGALENRGYFVDFDLGGDPEKIDAGLAPTDDWWRRLKDNIVAADALVFIVSPDSAASAICDREIEWADSLKKRVVPLSWRRIDYAGAPKRLSALNIAIPFSADGASEHLPFLGFERSLDLLCRSLDTDIAWLRLGRRYLSLALQWSEGGCSESHLLRSGQIAEAETWASRRPANAPEPAELLFEFLAASRKLEEETGRRLRRTIGRGFVDPVRSAVSEGRHERALRMLAAAAALAEDPDFELVPELWRAGNVAIGASRLRALLRIAGSSIKHCEINAAGDRALAVCDDNSVRLFSPATAELIGTIEGRWSNAMFAGNSHVVVDDRSAISLITADAGSAGRGPLAVRGDVKAVSRAGDRLVVLQDDRLMLHNSKTDEHITHLDKPEATVSEVLFNPNSSCFVVVADKTVIYEADRGIRVCALESGHDDIRVARFSPDGSRIVTGSMAHGASLWNAQTGERLAILPHEEPVIQVRFSADGRRIATLVKGRDVRLWDAAAHQLLGTLAAHDFVYSIDVNSDGSLVAVGIQDGTALLWSPDDGRSTKMFDHSGSVVQVLFFQNDTRLLSRGYDGEVRIWDAARGTDIAQFALPSGTFGHGMVYGEGKILIDQPPSKIAVLELSETTGENDGFPMLRVDRVVDRNAIGLGHYLNEGCASNDARYLAFLTTSQSFHVADTTTASFRSFELPPNTGALRAILAISRDGGRVALDVEGQVWLANLNSNVVAMLRLYDDQQAPILNTGVAKIEFSRDGGHVALMLEALDVKCWDCNSGHTFDSARARHRFEYPMQFGSFTGISRSAGNTFIDVAQLNAAFPRPIFWLRALTTSDPQRAMTFVPGQLILHDISRAGGACGTPGTILAASLARGIGSMSAVERKHLLLSEAPLDLAAALRGLLAGRETEIDIATAHFAQPLHPRLYKRRSPPIAVDLPPDIQLRPEPALLAPASEPTATVPKSALSPTPSSSRRYRRIVAWLIGTIIIVGAGAWFTAA